MEVLGYFQQPLLHVRKTLYGRKLNLGLGKEIELQATSKSYLFFWVFLCQALGP